MQGWIGYIGYIILVILYIQALLTAQEQWVPDKPAFISFILMLVVGIQSCFFSLIVAYSVGNLSHYVSGDNGQL